MDEEFQTILQQRTGEIVESQRNLLRDEFATAARVGLLKHGGGESAAAIARRCYSFADAMLEARASLAAGDVDERAGGERGF